MITRTTSPAPLDAWSEAVAADPLALADHRPEWTRACARTGRWADASRMYELDDGSHVVLPLMARTVGWLTIGASMPVGLGFGGLVGERARDGAVVAAVLDDLAALRWWSLRIRPEPTAAGLWQAAAPAGARMIPRRAHLLDVLPDDDAQLAAMRKSTRRQVRRCSERDEVTVEHGGSPALMDEYFDLWLTSVGRWAQAQHEPLWLSRRRALHRDPPARMHALAAELDGDLQVWLGRIDGKPAAATVLAMGRSAHATRAAMDRELVASTGLMQYLDWLTIGHARDRGASVLNMGESGTSESLALYKEGLGARPVDYVELRLERLPITPVDDAVRGAVKRVIGFRD